MKLVQVLICLVLIMPATCGAQPKKERPDTDIEKSMHQMGRAFRQLRKQAPDPAQNASSLELVATIKAAATEAQKHTPLKAANLPEQDRAAFAADYRKRMGEFIDMVGRLEEALKAGNNMEAVKLVAALGLTQKKDQKDFQSPNYD